MSATLAPDPALEPPGRSRIMASVLTADMARLGEECRRLEAAGVDGIHWDIMDGVAVPSLSMGPDVVAACRSCVQLPFEAHVMSYLPERFIDPLAAAGCNALTIHPDWVQNPRRTLQRIADAGLVPGIALSPGTPMEFAEWHADVIGLILVMTVEPGFGGQTHVAAMARKVERAAALAAEAGSRFIVEVDGGIAPETISAMVRAGARSSVVGSALWRAESMSAGVTALHEASAPPCAPSASQSPKE